MKAQPLVSVVVICFNGEQFLAEAIESVIAQTYDSWELFLVDDGSSDRSSAIMQDYVAKYPDKMTATNCISRSSRLCRAKCFPT